MDNGYELLVTAIINRACEDYLTAKRNIKFYEDKKKAYKRIKSKWGKKAKERPTPEGIERRRQLKLIMNQRTVNDVLLFFRGGWYKTLTDADGEAIIKRLDELVEQGVYHIGNPKGNKKRSTL